MLIIVIVVVTIILGFFLLRFFKIKKIRNEKKDAIRTASRSPSSIE